MLVHMSTTYVDIVNHFAFFLADTKVRRVLVCLAIIYNKNTD